MCCLKERENSGKCVRISDGFECEMNYAGLLFGACLIFIDLYLSLCLEITLYVLCVQDEKPDENCLLVRLPCSS